MLSVNYTFFKEYLCRFFPNLYHFNTVFIYSPSFYKILVAFSDIVCLKLSTFNSNAVFTCSSSSLKTLVAFNNAVYLKLSSSVILVCEFMTNMLKSIFLIWI